jgi:hypothetical protein
MRRIHKHFVGQPILAAAGFPAGSLLALPNQVTLIRCATV